MPSQRKLLVYLVCAIIAGVLLASIFRDHLVEITFLVISVCVLADGLVEGELSYGLRDAKRSYRRKESPLAYWFIAALWCVAIAAVSASLLDILPRTKAQPPVSTRRDAT